MIRRWRADDRRWLVLLGSGATRTADLVEAPADVFEVFGKGRAGGPFRPVEHDAVAVSAPVGCDLVWLGLGFGDAIGSADGEVGVVVGGAELVAAGAAALAAAESVPRPIDMSRAAFRVVAEGYPLDLLACLGGWRCQDADLAPIGEMAAGQPLGEPVQMRMPGGNALLGCKQLVCLVRPQLRMALLEFTNDGCSEVAGAKPVGPALLVEPVGDLMGKVRSLSRNEAAPSATSN